tara:strand:+ start:156 stop:263 length:108 start_codon:yes stop_codon:yes gene_type:complete
MERFAAKQPHITMAKHSFVVIVTGSMKHQGNGLYE